MKPKVLVTGASGFIGQHAVRFLLEAGVDVHAVTFSRSLDAGVAHFSHVCDLHDERAMRHLLETLRPDYLLHLAWHVPPGEFWHSPENSRWVKTSAALFQTFFEVGGRRVLSVGTCAEYDWTAPAPFDEDLTPILPTTPYGAAKAALATRLEQLTQQFPQKSSAWARLFFLYGPGEAQGRLVPSVVESLRSGQPALCTRGEQKRDFLYVEDAGRALVVTLLSSLEGKINIASGRSPAVQEVIQQLGQITGRSDLLRWGALPEREGEPPVIAANTRRLSALGFKPSVTLEEGLRKTITIGYPSSQKPQRKYVIKRAEIDDSAQRKI